MSGFQLPSSRYILPSFVERTSYGMKESNPYNKLFEERIIFLGVQIDDASANDVMAQLITLESTDPDRDITIYINSPGGSFTSLMAIYDTMMFVRPDIQTVCMGQAASAAAVLLAAGTPGKRLALPYSRVLIHQPSGEAGGQVSDLEIHAAEIERVRTQMEEILARHTGRTPEQVRTDIDRDKILTAHPGPGVRDRRPGDPEPEAQRAPAEELRSTPGRYGSRRRVSRPRPVPSEGPPPGGAVRRGSPVPSGTTRPDGLRPTGCVEGRGCRGRRVPSTSARSPAGSAGSPTSRSTGSGVEHGQSSKTAGPRTDGPFSPIWRSAGGTNR